MYQFNELHELEVQQNLEDAVRMSTPSKIKLMKGELTIEDIDFEEVEDIN